MNETINIAEQVPMVPEQIIGWIVAIFIMFCIAFVGYIIYQLFE